MDSRDPGAPFTVLYRWRIRPGAEDTFVDGWERVTRAIRRSCGSYGSRLHRADQGPWIGYARWPDRAARERCRHEETEGLRLMAEAGELVEELHLQLVSDLADEPLVPGGAARSGTPVRSVGGSGR